MPDLPGLRHYTAEFLPQHRRSARPDPRPDHQAEQRGQQRLAEMNRTVENNLNAIITTLETDEQEPAEDAR